MMKLVCLQGFLDQAFSQEAHQAFKTSKPWLRTGVVKISICRVFCLELQVNLYLNLRCGACLQTRVSLASCLNPQVKNRWDA